MLRNGAGMLQLLEEGCGEEDGTMELGALRWQVGMTVICRTTGTLGLGFVWFGAASDRVRLAPAFLTQGLSERIFTNYVRTELLRSSA